MGRIVDIAEKAGVSTKTVSRVLNGHPNISAKTRRKVEAAITDLNYYPKSTASRSEYLLNRGIGVLFGDPDAGYQVRLYRALLDACKEHSFFLAVDVFNEQSKDWGEQVREFLDRSQVKRLILVPPLCDSYEIQQLLKDRNIRFALLSPSRPVSGVHSIAMDDRLAALEMTQHLIDLGHRRIGFISGRQGHVATLLRRQGFDEAFAMAGLPGPDEALVRSGDFSFQPAMDAARELLNLSNPPTAIFASNDDMAAGVMLMAQTLGLSIPDDLSVTGFDGVSIARSVRPELTTVSQPYEQMANMAVKLVTEDQDQLAGQSGLHVLSHDLLIRGSSGPVHLTSQATVA